MVSKAKGSKFHRLRTGRQSGVPNKCLARNGHRWSPDGKVCERCGAYPPDNDSQ